MTLHLPPLLIVILDLFYTVQFNIQWIFKYPKNGNLQMYFIAVKCQIGLDIKIDLKPLTLVFLLKLLNWMVNGLLF